MQLILAPFCNSGKVSLTCLCLFSQFFSSNELFIVTLLKFAYETIVIHTVPKSMSIWGRRYDDWQHIDIVLVKSTAISMTHLCCRSQHYLVLDNNFRASTL